MSLEQEIKAKNQNIQKDASKVSELEKGKKDATEAKGILVAGIVDAYKEIKGKAPATVTNPLNGKAQDLEVSGKVKVLPGVEVEAKVKVPAVGDRYDIFQGLTKGDALKKALPDLKVCGLTGDKEGLVVRKEGKVQILGRDGKLDTSTFAVLADGSVIDSNDVRPGVHKIPRCYFGDQKEAEKYAASLKTDTSTETKETKKEDKEVTPAPGNLTKVGEAGSYSWSVQNMEMIGGNKVAGQIQISGPENKVFTKTNLNPSDNTYMSGSDAYRVDLKADSISYTKVQTGAIEGSDKEAGKVTFTDIPVEEQLKTTIRPDGAAITVVNEKLTGLVTGDGKFRFGITNDGDDLKSLTINRNGQPELVLTHKGDRRLEGQGDREYAILRGPDKKNYAVEAIDQEKIVLTEIDPIRGTMLKRITWSSKGGAAQVEKLEQEVTLPTS